MLPLRRLSANLPARSGQYSSRPFGSREFTISDDGGLLSSHFIQFHSLPRLGDKVRLRVGSRSQRHAYHSTSLNIATTAPPIPLFVALVK
jgi:hypothetical protein